MRRAESSGYKKIAMMDWFTAISPPFPGVARWWCDKWMSPKHSLFVCRGRPKMAVRIYNDLVAARGIPVRNGVSGLRWYNGECGRDRMRKLMLASAAMLGATSGIASAQTPVPAGANMMMQPSQGMMALPWAQGPSVEQQQQLLWASRTPIPVAPPSAKNAVPTPGTVVIRLNGRVEVDMAASWSPNADGPSAPRPTRSHSAPTCACIRASTAWRRTACVTARRSSCAKTSLAAPRSRPGAVPRAEPQHLHERSDRVRSPGVYLSRL